MFSAWNDRHVVDAAGRVRLVLLALASLLLASCTAVAHSAPGRTTPAPSAFASPSSPASARPPPSPSPSAASRGTAASGYRTYANPRYGFTTLWPASFRAEPPPADGDGQSWTWLDGRVKLAAYGANNVFGYSPRQDEAVDSRGLTVTYRAVSGNVVTVSGYQHNGRTIVYQRDFVGPGSIDTLYWSYPTSQKARWDAAVTVTAHAFQPGDLATSH